MLSWIRSTEVWVILGGGSFDGWMSWERLFRRFSSIDCAGLFEIGVRVAGVILLRKLFHGIYRFNAIDYLLVEEIEDRIVAQHV